MGNYLSYVLRPKNKNTRNAQDHDAQQTTAVRITFTYTTKNIVDAVCSCHRLSEGDQKA